RFGLTFLSVVVLLLTGCGALQPSPAAPKMYTIGVVSGGANMNAVADGFKAGMAELGYIEGKNVTYVYNGPASSPDKLDSIAKSAMDAKIDLLVAFSTPATQAAQRATAGTNMPVVFLPVTDAVK